MQISVQIGLNWNWPTGTELGKNPGADASYKECINYPEADACYKLNINITLKLTLVTMYRFFYQTLRLRLVTN